MGKTCDVCGKELGFFGKFRYADGYICKSCYEKASRQFTETIRDKSLSEIQVLCSVERDVESFRNFHLTGKIGNYLLIDNEHKKICVPGNRLTNKKVSEPRFYDVADIKKCTIAYDPYIPFEELDQMVKEQRSEDTISYLRIDLTFKNKRKESIQLLSNPVRIKSFAFRQSFQFAKRIQEEIHRLMASDVNVESEVQDEAI